MPCITCANICGANEGLKWRNEMQALIDAEAPSGDRRAKMIASFNRGLSRLSADLPDLHAGRRPGHSPLPGGRFQDRARDDGALRELTPDFRVPGALRAPGGEMVPVASSPTA